MKPATKPFVVADNSRRTLLLALGVGTLLLGFLIYGLVNMSNTVTQYRLEGTIVSKTFTPQAEEQITIGKSGVHEHTLDGTYTFEVRVEAENNRIYTIWVDKTVYEAQKVGDRYFFIRPRPAGTAGSR